jgi:maleylpyruvate isomerase
MPTEDVPAGETPEGALPEGAPPEGALPDGVEARIAMVDEATGELLMALAGAGWAGVDPGRATLCPGWTAGHVLTHLARNADGLRRSAEGARRGEDVLMYDSAEARDRDIAAGAGRSLLDLVADVTGSARALAVTWTDMDETAWGRQMPHHRLGPVPMTAAPTMRLGEVLIHHIDLAGPYGPADWPAAFVAGVLADAGGELAERLPDGITAEVRATDTGAAWTAGAGAGAPGAPGGGTEPAGAGASGGGRVTVSGPSWAVAAWLLGRRAAAGPALSAGGGDLPELKAWL